jgi:hypothetical protein
MIDDIPFVRRYCLTIDNIIFTENIVKKIIVLALSILLVTGLVQAQDDVSEEDQATIDNAMSAAPLAVAQDATIIDWNADEDGNLIVLREGTNEWVCFPARPVTPGNDPMCLDEMWMIWLDAFFSGTEPNITGLGLAYMLQGGIDPSNTDPSATEPAEGEEWHSAPPHVMLIFPEAIDTDLFTTDPHSGGPYIMWAGTPYEHIMMPVALEEE